MAFGAMLTLAAGCPDSPNGTIGEGGHASGAWTTRACPPRRLPTVGYQRRSTGGVSMAPGTPREARLWVWSPSPSAGTIVRHEIVVDDPPPRLPPQPRRRRRPLPHHRRRRL